MFRSLLLLLVLFIPQRTFSFVLASLCSLLKTMSDAVSSVLPFTITRCSLLFSCTCLLSLSLSLFRRSLDLSILSLVRHLSHIQSRSGNYVFDSLSEGEVCSEGRFCRDRGNLSEVDTKGQLDRGLFNSNPKARCRSIQCDDRSFSRLRKYIHLEDFPSERSDRESILLLAEETIGIIALFGNL